MLNGATGWLIWSVTPPLSKCERIQKELQLIANHAGLRSLQRRGEGQESFIRRLAGLGISANAATWAQSILTPSRNTTSRVSSGTGSRWSSRCRPTWAALPPAWPGVWQPVSHCPTHGWPAVISAKLVERLFFRPLRLAVPPECC
jgi:hypothetical protein